jgi:ATP-binding cassette subfamily B protein
VILVVERVSTIRDADEMAVLDDGAIVGLGSHEELVTICPTYAEIVGSAEEAVA